MLQRSYKNSQQAHEKTFSIINQYGNASQNCNMLTLHTHQSSYNNIQKKIKTENNKFWLEPGEIVTLCPADGVVN